jgi:hypothetical protein
LSSLWPVISNVLAGGEAPSELAAEVVALLDDWVADDAPRLDADDDGNYDEAGPLIFDALFEPLADALSRPFLGELIDEGYDIAGIGATGLIDKDLRTLLGQPVAGEFNVAYCGEGSLADCQAALWAVVDSVADALAAERGGDPTTWLREGQRSSFIPGLIPDDFRSTNRPTFQQVLEFAPN